mmetsp:Transcript_84279/g.236060  ORF Transcript_84279/g.236060 Transcript_84279/m.236060 type:complete len:217 (+) Transcript_84279:443-1093(+)
MASSMSAAASSSSFFDAKYSAVSLLRCSVVSANCCSTFFSNSSFSAIWEVNSAAFACDRTMFSECSSMVREAVMAFRVSNARSCSQFSLMFRSSASSARSKLSMLSIATRTSLKWPTSPLTKSATARTRWSLVRAAARLRTATAREQRRWALPLEASRCRKSRPWEAKDFLKVSRAPPLWSTETARLMASSSPARSAWRSCHSTFFSDSASWTWMM